MLTPEQSCGSARTQSADGQRLPQSLRAHGGNERFEPIGSDATEHTHYAHSLPRSTHVDVLCQPTHAYPR